MEIVSYSSPPEDWQEIENYATSSTFWQSAYWGTFEKSHGNSVVYVRILDDNKVSAQLLFSKRGEIFVSWKCPTYLFSPSAKVFDTLLKWLKRKLENNVLVLLPEWHYHDLLEKNGFKFYGYEATFIIDLRKSLGEILSAFTRRQHRALRKAICHECEVEVGDDGYYKEYLSLRKNYIQGIPTHKIFSPKYLREFMRLGNVVIFIAKVKNKISSVGIFPYTQTTIENRFLVSDKRLRKYQPNVLLYWRAIQWAKDRKIRYFDFGGVRLAPPKGSKEYAIKKFYEGFGGNLITFPVYGTL